MNIKEFRSYTNYQVDEATLERQKQSKQLEGYRSSLKMYIVGKGTPRPVLGKDEHIKFLYGLDLEKDKPLEGLSFEDYSVLKLEENVNGDTILKHYSGLYVMNSELYESYKKARKLHSIFLRHEDSLKDLFDDLIVKYDILFVILWLNILPVFGYMFYTVENPIPFSDTEMLTYLIYYNLGILSLILLGVMLYRMVALPFLRKRVFYDIRFMSDKFEEARKKGVV